MASTYDTARSRPLDRVRARVRDTGQFDVTKSGKQAIKGAFATDEEIGALITAHGESEAAALLAEEWAAFLNLEPSKVDQANGISFSYGDRAKALMNLAASIRAQAAPGGAVGRYGNTSPTVSVCNDVQY